MELPDWIDEGLWQEWIAYRREDKNKPASERSQRMTIRKLERLRAEGYDANRLIEHAIEHEWQGIYPHEDCKSEANRANPSRKLSAAERFRAANTPALRVVGAHGRDIRDTLDESAARDAEPWLGAHAERLIGG